MFRDSRKRLHRNLVFVGIVIILAGFFASGILGKFNETAVETTASITRIDEKEEGKLLSKNKVFVTYRVDGVGYEHELGYYEDEMTAGQSVQVKYDPKNPGNMRAADGPDVVKTIYIIGAAVAVYGIIANIIMRRNEQRRAERKAERKLEKKYNK